MFIIVFLDYSYKYFKIRGDISYIIIFSGFLENCHTEQVGQREPKEETGSRVPDPRLGRTQELR